MSTPAPSQRYSLHPHARFRVLDDEGIFILQEAGEVVVVNKLGAFIIEQLRAEQALDQIAQMVAAEYEVSAERAREDAERLISELAEAGALRPL